MILPRLRLDLHVSPSPDPQNPGLFVRDQFRYTDAWLIIPALLVQGLKYFNGVHSRADLEAEFCRLTGQPDTSAIAANLIEGLDKSGFLENETFAAMKLARMRVFADSPVRQAIHAGAAYPNDATALHDMIRSYLDGAPQSDAHVDGLIAIAAPHVSPGGGPQSYGAAYRMLTPDLADRTFVILGTSHYGQQNRFGLTRKPFETPFGISGIDTAFIDELAAEPAVIMEDYCEAVEHSIEFQVLFLQHLYGPNVKIVPLLCGHYGPSIAEGGKPEDDATVAAFLERLRTIAERDREKLFWILGVDMAHIGTQYGDALPVQAEQDRMLDVRARDMERIASLTAGDADAFWRRIQVGQDDLRWCGSSPMYTFLKVCPTATGRLQHYQQWNIDAQSVVTFAGLAFFGSARQ